MLACHDRPFNFGVIITGVVGRQPNLVEGNLRYLFQNSVVDLACTRSSSAFETLAEAHVLRLLNRLPLLLRNVCA